MEKKKAEAIKNSRTGTSMKGNLKMTWPMDMVNTLGYLANTMKVTMKTMFRKAKEFILGLMGNIMKEK